MAIKKIVQLKFTLTAIILVVWAFMIFLNQSQKNISLLNEFSKEDPIFINYLKSTENFNHEREIFLLVEKRDSSPLNNQEWISTAQFIEKQLEGTPGIEHILSPLDWYLPTIENNHLRFQSFISNEKINPSFLTHPLFSRFLVGQNFSSYLISVKLAPSDRTQVLQHLHSLEDIIQFIQKKFEYASISIMGVEILRKELRNEVIYSYAVLLPIIVMMVALTLFFFLRSLSLTLIGLIILGICFLTTASLIIIWEGTLSPLSSLALIFVFVVATSDLAHLLIHWVEHKGQFKAVKKHIFIPCLYTSLTTFIGLSSLLFSSVLTLKNFGFYGCLGVNICFICTFYLAPELLSLIQPPKIDVGSSRFYHLPKFSTLKILFFTSFFSIILVIGSFNIQISDDFYKKFTSDHPITKTISSFEQNFSFLSTIDVIMPHEKINLELIDQLKTIPEVQSIKSLKQLLPSEQEKYLGVLRSSIAKTPLGKYFLPEKSFESERIILHLRDLEIRTVLQAKKHITRIIPDANVEGFALLRAHFFHELGKSYYTSLMTSFLLIFICFLFAYRSFYWAIVAMIPNIPPVLFITGLIGLTGMSADMNLPLFCSLTLGISVDNTIHFLHHLRSPEYAGLSLDNKIQQAHLKVIKPMILTTILLVLSFLVFYGSHVQLFSQLSYLMAGSLSMALGLDLFLLPALLRFCEQKWPGKLFDT